MIPGLLEASTRSIRVCLKGFGVFGLGFREFCAEPTETSKRVDALVTSPINNRDWIAMQLDR